MKKPQNYKEIFNHRGEAYNEAMRTLPNARAKEFLAAVEMLPDSKGSVILDVPSGGNYLSDYLNHAQMVCADPATMFQYRNRGAVVEIKDLHRLPFEENSFDAAVSLAGLHHSDLEERVLFYNDCYRVLKPACSLTLVEVAKKTPVARFLNEFVDHYNEQGHRGLFFESTTETSLLYSAGFNNINSIMVSCDWSFASQQDMVWFCKKLFGLDLANDNDVLVGLCEYLSIEKIDNRWTVPWQLIRLTASK